MMRTQSIPVRRFAATGSLAMLWALPVILTLAYVLPFAGVTLWSVTRPEFGFENYVRIFTGADFQAIFLRTFWVCLVSTAITIPIAYLLAYYWVMGSARRSRLVEICIFIPFWISVLVRAFGWVVILRNNGLASDVAGAFGLGGLSTGRNVWSVITGMVHFMVPFAVLPIASVMRKIDRRVLLAALGLGCRPLGVFWRIYLPMSMPGVFSTLAMTFIFSLGFFVTPMILGGGRVVLTAESVFVQMFQTANWGLGAALGVVLLVVVFAILWLSQRVMRIEQLMSR
ncbi:ABC transporter permease (plasmid) [Ensifer adhaerens]|uniref:ABC transporter permease n=1 Tax=Ensifer adhaerens TaxID=106592 RepID=UPI0023A97CAE|nr:ABC transporter permease [Ensifer adhaerens]WDZ80586.1 ABC transporter permease [Ensifer adhaerens]